MNRERYVTRGGVVVHRTIENIPIAGAIEPVIDALDTRRGVLLTSSYEYRAATRAGTWASSIRPWC